MNKLDVVGYLIAAKKYIFKSILWVNSYVFEPLNGSVRIDAFVGIVGILVAVVIFIAETLNNTKVETQKRFILEKTKMQKSMILSIIILSFCILKEIIPYSSDSNNIVQIFFFVEELVLNVFIIISICLTIRLFLIAIKLNTDNDYFSSEYDKYIEGKLIKIHEKNISYSNEKLKNESIQKFVKENNQFFSLDLDNLEEYVPIKFNKSGIFKTYSCRALQTIVDKIEETNINNKEFVMPSGPLILLPLKGGEKLNRGVTIAYCKNSIVINEDSIRNSCLLNDSIPFQDNEITLIFTDLYCLAGENIDDCFDYDGRLFKFCDYLYKNDMRASLEIFYDRIRNVYIDYYKDVQKNEKLAKFLSHLAGLAYSNEDFEKYKYLCDYIYYCYTEQLNYADDIRKVSYNYTNSLFRYDFYSIKRNTDSIYFDVLLSNLMNFLFDLIEKKEFKAINDLFNNVIFDYNSIIDEEPDSYDVIKIQFSYGFVYGLVILCNKKIFNKDDKANLKSLINYIKSNFVDVYSQNDAIYYFKKYFNKKSNVQNVYNNFDFRFQNKEYRNSWSGIHVDDTIILKEFIYIFRVRFSDLEKINSELISKDDIYFYNSLLESVKSEDKSNIDEILDINLDKDSLINLLQILVEKCKKAKDYFIKNNEISEKQKTNFKKVIFENIEKGNDLLLYLKKNSKYSLLRKKSKRIFGFNQIIGRDLFFDDVHGLDNVSKEYARGILNGISKDYLKKLDSISEVNKQNLLEYIKKSDISDQYVIITNYINLRTLNQNEFDDKKINIEGKKIDLILVPNAREIYLINKKDLPKLEMYVPDVLENGALKKGVYYNLIDCSTDALTREEILKNTKWLAEKGNVDEQIEYLKGKCILKLFVSPSIRKIPKSKCYKFIIEEYDE